MQRLADKRLEELREAGKTIYSISRLDCINRCLYEAYRTYILGDRGGQNCYASLGGRIHDVLEGITNETHTEVDLFPAMMKELEDIELAGLEFPKDRNGGDSIKEHWVQDMSHFCATYKAPTGKNLHAEELFIYQTPADNYVQGYIDLYRVRKDGSLDLYDYKTSSMYKGEELKEHSRQLITYALGMEQQGYKVNSASFIFLKYAEVSYIGKKTARSKEETLIKKCIERYKIGETLQPIVEAKLSALGWDDLDVEGVMMDFKRTNRLESLPEEIRSQFTIKPYVLSVDLSDENKQETIDYIDGTIKKWEALGDDEKTYVPRSFTRTKKDGGVADQSFYCNMLCGHSKHCPYLQDYLQTLDKTNEDEGDIFS